jgi:hypothetical protein
MVIAERKGRKTPTFRQTENLSFLPPPRSTLARILLLFAASRFVFSSFAVKRLGSCLVALFSFRFFLNRENLPCLCLIALFLFAVLSLIYCLRWWIPDLDVFVGAEDELSSNSILNWKEIDAFRESPSFFGPESWPSHALEISSKTPLACSFLSLS